MPLRCKSRRTLLRAQSKLNNKQQLKSDLINLRRALINLSKLSFNKITMCWRRNPEKKNNFFVFSFSPLLFPFFSSVHRSRSTVTIDGVSLDVLNENLIRLLEELDNKHSRTPRLAIRFIYATFPVNSLSYPVSFHILVETLSHFIAKSF